MALVQQNLRLRDNYQLKFGDAATGDVYAAWDGSALNILPAVDDTGAINFGNGTKDMDVKFFLGTTTEYALFDVGSSKFTLAYAKTSQTTENIVEDISFSTDSTFVTGTNVTYSGGRGSAALKFTGAFSGASGGYHSIYSLITSSGALAADGDGVVGIKSVVLNSAAITDGNMYALQGIAKHSHATNKAANAAPLVGVEGSVMTGAAAPAGTCIGVSAAYHIDATTGAFDAGAVWRALQITCDSGSANNPSESTGLCIWNMAGTQDYGINFVKSASGFTTDIKLQNGETIDNATDGTIKLTATVVDINGGATDPALKLSGAGSKSAAAFATAGTAWVDGGTPAFAADQMYARINVGGTTYRLPLWADA